MKKANLTTTLKNTFSHTYFLYTWIALIIFIFAYSLTALVPHSKSIVSFLGLPISIFERLGLVLNLYGNIFSNSTVLSFTLALLLAIIFSLNISLIIYYIKHHRVPKKYRKKNITKLSSITSAAGFVSAIFGIGCAACGAALVGSFLTLVGAGGLLVLLPLHGQEMSILAIVLMIYGSHRILRHIQKPPVCEI